MTPFPFQMSNKLYNFLKWFITIFLPAVGTLYYGMAEAFDFERVTGVLPAITALIAFLGIVLGISSSQYNKTVNAPDGSLIVEEVDGEKYVGLGVPSSIEAMTSKDEVRLTVVDKTNGPRLP